MSEFEMIINKMELAIATAKKMPEELYAVSIDFTYESDRLGSATLLVHDHGDFGAALLKYADMAGLYHKLDDKGNGLKFLYVIDENGTVIMQVVGHKEVKDADAGTETAPED